MKKIGATAPTPEMEEQAASAKDLIVLEDDTPMLRSKRVIFSINLPSKVVPQGYFKVLVIQKPQNPNLLKVLEAFPYGNPLAVFDFWEYFKHIFHPL